jgi:hypothetical protein
MEGRKDGVGEKRLRFVNLFDDGREGDWEYELKGYSPFGDGGWMIMGNTITCLGGALAMAMTA